MIGMPRSRVTMDEPSAWRARARTYASADLARAVGLLPGDGVDRCDGIWITADPELPEGVITILNRRAGFVPVSYCLRASGASGDGRDADADADLARRYVRDARGQGGRAGEAGGSGRHDAGRAATLHRTDARRGDLRAAADADARTHVYSGAELLDRAERRRAVPHRSRADVVLGALATGAAFVFGVIVIVVTLVMIVQLAQQLIGGF